MDEEPVASSTPSTSLPTKTERIRTLLGLDEALPVDEVIAQASTLLEMPSAEPLSLAAQADALLANLDDVSPAPRSTRASHSEGDDVRRSQYEFLERWQRSMTTTAI